MIKKMYFLPVLLIFGFGLCVSAQQKESRKCKFTGKGGNYKVVTSVRTSLEPKIVDLRIFVEPKNFNEAFIRKLADRLTSEYCNEDKVYAVIFDNRKLARDSFYLEDYVRTRGKLIQMRGFYTLDRSTGEKVIEFSTKFGNPTSEIQIDLSSNKKSSSLIPTIITCM